MQNRWKKIYTWEKIKEPELYQCSQDVMLDFTKSGEEIEIAGACQDFDAQLLDIEWINEWKQIRDKK